MRPRVRSALLWGLVGALAFLVLGQGYRLLADGRVDLPLLLAVALVVGVATTLLAYVGEARLRHRRLRSERD